MWLSHQLACQLFGLNPWGHHLINVLLHAINTVLVFLLLRSLTGAFWRSVMVAVLFGWHPLRVESVAWVTERKDVLSTFFGLLALIYYVRYAQNKTSRNPQPSTLNYLLALVFFAFGLMSKAMLVTWPCVMLLLDWWPMERYKTVKVRWLVAEKIPFFVLAAAASVVTFLVQKYSGAVASIRYIPLASRLGNALISYCRYLGKLFWPVDLAVFYPHPGSWPTEEVVLAGVLLLGITVWCILGRRRYPFMLIGWLWYVGTLVPVIGLVQVGDQSLADRYTYIPSIGVLVLVIWGAYELTRRWRNRVIILSVAGCGAIILCLGLTRQQLGYWKNSETLFRHALAVTQNNYLMHDNLGLTLGKEGQIDEAIKQFEEALRLKPNFANAYNNLGTALTRKGQIDQAISRYQEAIRLKPDYAEAYYNLGAALGMDGQIDQAISEFQKAIHLKPDFAEAHYNLGVAQGIKGQVPAAISQYREAIRLKPDYARAHNELGTLLSMKGQINGAISEFQEALRLEPDFTEARSNLERVLETKNASTNQ